jgi:hypothetical protein
MTHASLLNEDWADVVRRLGGSELVERSARETKAFLRPREIDTAEDLLRLILAYCLGEKGLRLTAAWASAMGLVDISNVALLYRLRQCGDWFCFLIGRLLSRATPKAAQGRLIRLIDATTVPKAGAHDKTQGKLWRIHSAFDLPHERFGHFELTDETGGERLDRIPVVPGEIRIADRAYLQPDRMAGVIEAGADILIRANWKNARWIDEEGRPLDLVSCLRKAAAIGRLDRPICIARKGAAPLALRLVAVRKPPELAAAARQKARKEAKRRGHQISQKTLVAAEWVILVTSLAPEAFSTDEVLDLYRLRWRIELAFKRLKSVVGLKGPPGRSERSARPYILAHLLAILLLEPLVDALEVSPRRPQAA